MLKKKLCVIIEAIFLFTLKKVMHGFPRIPKRKAASRKNIELMNTVRLRKIFGNLKDR